MLKELFQFVLDNYITEEKKENKYFAILTNTKTGKNLQIEISKSRQWSFCWTTSY